MMHRPGWAVLLAGTMAAAGDPGWLRALQPEAPRTVIILSDLHMGQGREESGRWRPHEDFRWTPELSEFLRVVDEQNGSAVDLVLNGDTLELPQREPEAADELDRVLTAHAEAIDALGRFAGTGANRLIFVPGDRDAALRFRSVTERLIRRLRAPADRVTVASAGYWVSADGQVHAEHGHEIGYRSADFRVIQALMDRLEADYPIVDNVALLGAGVKYALAATPAIEPGEAGALLVRYALLNVSWQQFRMELDDGEVQPPIWNIVQAREQGASLLVSSLPEDDPLKPWAVKLAAENRLAEIAGALSDDEITALCDYRAAVRRARRRFEPPVSQFAPRGPAISECPRSAETRGAIFDYFWRSRDDLFARYVQAATTRLGATRPPVVFALGHTHLADRAQSTANMISGGLLKIPMEGFSPVRGALTPVVINGGAWQRTITPAQLERLRTERGVSGPELLRLQPEDLPPCYSYVFIAASPQRTAAVRYWRPPTGTAAGSGALCAG